MLRCIVTVGPQSDYIPAERMEMNVNLGTPYEAIIERMIERGYAGNQTEVIRQALMALDRQIEEEEARLVHKAVGVEMQKIRDGKTKTYPAKKVFKEAGLE